MQTMTRRANLLIRACRRCGGDLYRDMLELDEEFVCLQCGRRPDLTKVERPPAQVSSASEWRSVA